MPELLVDRESLLLKFPGKGGWTYALIPEIAPDPHAHFGWVIVSGSIDDFPLKKVKLQPFGNGQVMLSVKAEIRKKIKKQAGDWVHVRLYKDDSPMEIPDELKECLINESIKVYEQFVKWDEIAIKSELDRIYQAKTEETKAQRIIQLIERLLEEVK